LNIRIRKGEVEDFPAIFSMIKELAEFERAPEKVTNSVERMKREKEFFFTIIAENDDREILGFALYYFVYYTWVGKSLYLDDLYVREKYRDNGIGSKLLKEVLEFAKEEDCRRIRWQVLNWNKPAIEVYKKLGADLDNDWINCDFVFDEKDNLNSQ